jgi:hypothetical protein
MMADLAALLGRETLRRASWPFLSWHQRAESRGLAGGARILTPPLNARKFQVKA